MSPEEQSKYNSSDGFLDQELKCDICGGNVWLASPGNGVAGTPYTGLDEAELRHKYELEDGAHNQPTSIYLFIVDKGSKHSNIPGCNGCEKSFVDGDEAYRTEFDVFYDEGEYGVTESKATEAEDSKLGLGGLICQSCEKDFDKEGEILFVIEETESGDGLDVCKKQMHDLSGTIYSEEDLEVAIKEFVFNYYCGLNEVEEELITRGKIALVEYKDDPEAITGKIFLAEVVEEDSNLLNKYDTVKLRLLANKKIEIQSNKKTYPYKYVVFENNRANEAYMKRINYFIKQMIEAVKKMAIDAFMSERKLIFIVPEQPAEEDANYLIQMRPEKGASDGKTGIHPSQVKFETYEPKLDIRA
ncbi:818_t:CDS:2 [Racocetra fulgida]|uniref:818_t:CDS:1 n=1 Tax=Racocetra fulgida TaxID=60492 RepID=A0A9N8VER6_9GLOM|nr:818_t:CDS:2 [Racocetra fulgida]